MKTRIIRQQVTFRASPHEVYEALMDEKKHGRFTQSKTSISRQVGGRFTSGDGYIEGVNLELIPDRKIVQSWHASDWPSGHYSKAAFALTPVKGGTRLTFTHSGVPEEFYDDISQGWRDYYWQPMKEMLEKI